jgi:hypothetical protein
MNERAYLFLTGVIILLALYVESNVMIYSISALLLFEAVTDIRLTIFLQRMQHITLDSGLVLLRTRQRFNLDALRVLRFMVSSVLLISYAALHEYGIDVIWFFPWFMGFAIMGAGASGVCPLLLALRWIGFR